MNSEKLAYKSGNIHTLLLIMFVVLKLTNNINWSWWWVLSPLWIPLIFVFVLALAMIAVGDDTNRR